MGGRFGMMPGYVIEMPTYTNGMSKYYGEGHVKRKIYTSRRYGLQ